MAKFVLECNQCSGHDFHEDTCNDVFVCQECGTEISTEDTGEHLAEED